MLVQRHKYDIVLIQILLAHLNYMYMYLKTAENHQNYMYRYRVRYNACTCNNEDKRSLFMYKIMLSIYKQCMFYYRKPNSPAGLLYTLLAW